MGLFAITLKEHSVLLTGYDSQNIYFYDPLANIKDRGFSKSDFIAGWQQYGSQTVTYQ